MTVKIENEVLVATFQEKGGELISLQNKETGIEYIWQGDPAFWGRHAPVLFPIVGRLKEDRYQYAGKTYQMTQHGFARDMVFEIVQATAEEVHFELTSSPETKKAYPFDFHLLLTYQLTGSTLEVGYLVKNPSENQELYFSIGGHPAFNVPLEKGLGFEDYYLSFTPQKSRVRLPLAGAYVDYEKRTLGQTNTNIRLQRQLFEQDALIFETKGGNAFTIESEASPYKVTVAYDNLPFVGIWSPYPKEAPFVCIEPWAGIADTVTAKGELNEKLGINHLAPQEVFTRSYQITVV